MSGCENGECGIDTIAGAQAAGGGSVPSAQGAPGWQLGYEIDFREFPIADLTNGDHVIDGRTWRAANRTAATTFNITAAAGLNFVANATSGLYVATQASRTAPFIDIALGDLMPGFDPHLDYYFQIYVSAINADATAENVRHGLVGDIGVPSSSVDRFIAAGIGFPGASQTAFIVQGGTATGTTTFTPASTWNTPGFHVGGHIGFSLAGSFGQWNSADDEWPAMSELRVGAGQTSAGAGSTSTMQDPVNNRYVIAFPTGNTSNNFAAVVQRLRILVR